MVVAADVVDAVVVAVAARRAVLPERLRLQQALHLPHLQRQHLQLVARRRAAALVPVVAVDEAALVAVVDAAAVAALPAQSPCIARSNLVVVKRPA